MRSRWLALGDSYTIGEGVAESERWPARLASLLRERGLAVDDPQIVARTGWTTDELSAGIDRLVPLGVFGLVTLLVGVNDQYRGLPLDGYRTRFRGLLARAVSLAAGDASRVLVLSIPDWGATPFAATDRRGPARIAEEIDRFNGAARDETTRAGARWVDVTPASRRVHGEAAWLAGDGLHPSGRLYAEWACLALPAALAALGAAG